MRQLIPILFFTSVCTNPIVQLEINNSSKWTISPYLASMHMLYTNGADGVYDEKMIEWVKKNNIISGRFPGGTTASYWDWEHPCGLMGCWALDPKFDESQRANESEWMSLREYMDFVDATGMTPLVGVNYNNHGHLEWMSEKDSIAKAVRQAEYVVNTRGYKVHI